MKKLLVAAACVALCACSSNESPPGGGDAANNGAGNNGSNNGAGNNGGNNGRANNGANNGPANNGPANNGPANNGANNGPANNGPANNGAADEFTYHRDIKPLLEARCNECHRQGGIAPFAFDSFESVAALSASIGDSVETGAMPPWLASDECQDYHDVKTLTAEQRRAITTWVTDGAPEGDATDPPRDWDIAAPRPFRTDVSLQIREPYTPKNAPDDYHCFLVDWPEDEETFVTGFRVNPDNDAMLHHVIAFLVPPELAAEYEALDAGEEGPGYTCYGGPGGDVSRGFYWLGGWAPGNPGVVARESHGIRVPPGSKVALQVHYNTINGTGTDQSSVEFTVEREVEQQAWVVPFTNPYWIFDDSMQIPSGRESVTHNFQFDVTQYLSRITNGEMEDGAFLIHNASLHMHQLGVRARVSVKRTNGEECILDIPDWDFDWQRPFQLKEPILVQPGDQVYLECTWDNSAANQPYDNVDTNGDGEVDEYRQVAPRDVSWGDGTRSEMCLAILYATQP